ERLQPIRLVRCSVRVQVYETGGHHQSARIDLVLAYDFFLRDGGDLTVDEPHVAKIIELRFWIHHAAAQNHAVVDAARHRSPCMCTEPQTDRTRQRNRLLRRSQPAALLVPTEHDDRIRLLVGDEQPPPARIEAEIAWPVPTRRDHLNRGERSG